MTEHGPNLYDEIPRLQRVRLPRTPARRLADFHKQGGLHPDPEPNRIRPRVPGTRDKIRKRNTLTFPEEALPAHIRKPEI